MGNIYQDILNYFVFLLILNPAAQSFSSLGTTRFTERELAQLSLGQPISPLFQEPHLPH